MWFPKCHLLLLVRHPNCYSRLCCRKSAESRSQSRVPTGLGRTVVAIHDSAMTSGRLECPAMFSSFFTDIYAYYFQYTQHNDEAYTLLQHSLVVLAARLFRHPELHPHRLTFPLPVTRVHHRYPSCLPNLISQQLTVSAASRRADGPSCRVKTHDSDATRSLGCL